MAAGLQEAVQTATRWGGRLWRTLRGQTAREMPRVGREQLNLTDLELEATIEQIIDHPWMGGKKRAANLAHDQVVWLGAQACDAIKNTMAQLAGQALADRRQPRQTPVFKLEKPTMLNQAWSADFLTLKVWGKSFDICAHQDLFSQEKLSVNAIEGTADSLFLRGCFEQARAARGGAPPTLYYKSDNGPQFCSKLFEDALEGLCLHVRIPPGCPFFNGEIERGQRDLHSVLRGLLTKRSRPRSGDELAAVQRACLRALRILNDQIARPSLGNLTPSEKAAGDETVQEVQQRTRDFVVAQRHQRRNRKPPAEPWQVRLGRLFQADSRTTGSLLRFLRLKNRDYTAWSKPDPARPT